MSLTISGEGSADNLPKLAKGTYLGTCFRIVDLGTSDQEYKGVVSKKTRVHITFEITKALDPGNNEVVMEDGRPFAVSKTYTASLFEAATLRKDLENWRDKSFTEEELKGFDIENRILSEDVPLDIFIVSDKQTKDFSKKLSLQRPFFSSRPSLV